MEIDDVFANHLDGLCEVGGANPALSRGATRLTFSELRDCIMGTAHSLWTEGFRAGDRVGLRVGDEYHHFVLTLALILLGTSHVATPRFDSAHQISRLLARVAAAKVISDSDAYRLVVERPSSAVRKTVASGKRGGVFLRTSGSMEESRLLLFSSQDFIDQASNSAVSGSAAFLRFAHLEHNASRRHRLYAFLRGAHNVFLSSEDAWISDPAEVKAHGVDTVEMARSHLLSLIQLEMGKRFWSGIDFYTSGSPVPVATRMLFMEKVSPRFYVRYGATEAGSLAIAGPGDHEIPGCVGRPLATLHHTVATGTRDQPARIILKSPGMASGYYESARNDVYFQDGWFLPGDLGYVEDGGRLCLAGREGRAFTVGSINVFPEEIESALSRFPGIREVVVTGLPSVLHDHIPVAVVTTQQSAAFSPQEFLDWSRDELGLVAPRAVRLIDAMPRTSEGKVDFRRAWDAASGTDYSE